MGTFDATGLDVPRTAELRDQLKAAFRASSVFGPAMNLSDEADAPLVEVVDIFVERLNLLYELLLEVYLARDPNSAPGVALENLMALVGVYRLPATAATSTVTLVGDGTATTVPAGSRMSVGAGGAIFATTVAVDLPALAPYEADVVVAADTTGAQAYAANAIDTIVDAVAHWSDISASTAVNSGRPVETDTQLRLRYRRSLQKPGASTDGAARARLEDIDGVEAAFVVSNRTDIADPVTGQPAHSRWAVLYPDTVDQELVAAALWETDPAGIADFGAMSATVTDNQGTAQVVKWDWATPLEMWARADINDHTWAASTVVANRTAVAELIVEYAATLTVGEDVCPTVIVSYIMQRIDGIRDMDVYAATHYPTTVADNDPVDVPFYNIAFIPLANVSVVAY